MNSYVHEWVFSEVRSYPDRLPEYPRGSYLPDQLHVLELYQSQKRYTTNQQ